MAEENKEPNNSVTEGGVDLPQTSENRWSVQRYRGLLPYETARKLKFGEGDRTIKFDVLQGFWAGNEVYSVSTFRMTSTGTVERIVLKTNTTFPTAGLLGELLFMSTGSLYVCSSISPVTWSLVGKQN